MKRVFNKPYIYWAIAVFLIYFIINFWISGFYSNIELIIANAQTVNWLKLGISFALSLIIGILVSMTMVYAYIRYKERKTCLEGNVAASLGTLGGLATGFCPLCITGLFPLIFSLLGVSFSFASLPFGGIEIQILVVVVLIASLLMLKK